MKKALLTLLALCCLTLPAQAAGFSDVPEDHWAAGPIQEAAEAGVISGYGDGSFRPQAEVTAAHFCAVLSRSFLAEELSGQSSWEHRYLDACLPILEGTEVYAAYQEAGNRWGDFADQPLSRYDMARILCSLVSKEGAAPGEEAARAAGPEIADWEEIPESYRAAVSACWSMGLLRGQSGGRFAGEDTLNRAQAAVIWSRLDGLLQESGQSPEEDPGGEERDMPAFGLQGDETVQQMMDRVNAGTPRCKEGCLPNGKTRTEEHILELLELVKQGCPEGAVWSSTTRYDYSAPSAGPVKGCLSFGMAVSDFLFGEETPVTQHRSFDTLKPGDMVHIKGGYAERVLILTGVDREKDSFAACELKENGKVSWSAWGPLSGLIDRHGVTTVYSRA